jgi:acyl dehydratase
VTAISVCPEVTRVDIAWTCVATDDPGRLHLDEEFAVREAGHASVMAPGTMLLGWIGEHLERLAGGPEMLQAWSVRFTAPVWPGDIITLAPASPDQPPDKTGATVTATNERGAVVATARYRLAPSAANGMEGTGHGGS